MPDRPSRPTRRAPVARRAPVRARRHSSSSSAGLWIGLLGLLAVAGSIVLGAWYVKRGLADPALAPEAASQQAPPAVAAEPTPAAASVELVQRAMAEAPVLTPESARALLTEMARRGQGPGHSLDSALLVASVGFEDLDRATLVELGGDLARSWSPRSASEQSRIQAYMRHVREGEPLSPEAITEGRALFAEGVRALPAASQERLTALFARALDAGIAHQQQAEERARVAAVTPLIAAEAPSPAEETPPPSAPGATADATRRPGSRATNPVETADGPSPSSEAAESPSPGDSDWDKLNAKAQRWRQAYRSAKADVDRLEAEVAKLEEDAKNNFVAGYRTVRIGDQLITENPDPNSPYKSYAERIQTRLPAARRELADAKLKLAAVEDAARRDGVASGQLY
jgi:hypothetical protein